MATEVSFQYVAGGPAASTAADDYTAILSAVQKRLQSWTKNETGATVSFDYSNGVAVGVFVGADMDPAATPQVLKTYRPATGERNGCPALW